MKRLSFWLVVMIFGLSGCLAPPPPGVSVKAVTADLVFGVPPLEEPPAPPAFEEPVAETTQTPPPRRPNPNVPRPTQVPCPKAPDQTFPEEEATTIVKSRAATGSYRWKFALSFAPTGGATETFFDDFTYKGQTEARELTPSSFSFGTGEFTFYVTDPERVFVVVQVYEVRQNNPAQEGDGIYLTEIIRTDREGNRSRFQPEPALLILPLPVRLGLEFQSAGVDASFAVIRHTGKVDRRQRVDVCGKVIDSWYVDGQQEFISPGGTSYQLNYDYGVATQLGGIIVIEHIEEETGEGRLIRDLSLGELEPSFALFPQFQEGT